MLDQSLIDAVKGYAEKLTKDVIFVVQTGEHEKRAQLIEFLNAFASASPRLHAHWPLDGSGEYTEVSWKEIDFQVKLNKGFFTLQKLKSL